MLSLLIETTDNIEIIESAAHDVESLFQDVSRINPDMILVEESSPLCTELRLFPVLMGKPGRPVVVVSQEHNRMHVVHWQTVQLSSLHDLINTIKLV